MYRGDLVELLDIAQLEAGPRHRYTRALIEAVPRPVGGTTNITIGRHSPRPIPGGFDK
jgi:ABC-type dipeptide/oligopeptide/nickel transport system ATPase component